MKCIEVKKNLELFFDEEIDSSKKIEVKSHLESCESCQANLNNLQVYRKSIKQSLPIIAPALLDEKVLTAFQNHHAEKKLNKIAAKQETISWLGIPKLAFAVALPCLFAFFTISAFYLGKVSASNVSVSFPKVNNAQPVSNLKLENNVVRENPKDDQGALNIIEIPIIKEKVVIRTIYLKPKSFQKTALVQTALWKKKPNEKLDSSIFRIATDLNPQIINKEEKETGFQIAPQLNPQIIKKGETDE